MKKTFLAVMLFAIASYGIACTNFIATKGATIDGSVLVTYNADDYGLFAKLCHYAGGKHQKGDKYEIIDYDTHASHGFIPQAPITYNVIGNINEYQVSIGETTYGGRKEMIDKSGQIDYGSLMYLGLQRARTAREAIKVMTSLAETYGYSSGGETFTIADPNEVWILEMQGCGGAPNNKVVWVAVRIPDGMISAHANQSRIGQFSKYNTEVVKSKNCIKFARSKGWFKGKDADFSWKNVYAKPTFGGRRWCEARVWSFFNHFKDMSRWLPWALGKDAAAEDMPLWIEPNKKLDVSVMAACMRDHYEGTPLALDNDIAAGPWNTPYRPTPLVYEVNGKKYFNERPTSTQQTAFSYIAQLRSFLPREIGGVIWWGNDDGNMVAYVPIYCGITKQPECFNTPGVDAVTFSDKNAYWVCNWVANMVYPRYAQLFPALKKVRDNIEGSFLRSQPEIEAKAKALYDTDKAAALELLSEYSSAKASEMMDSWRKLATYLIVKFNDMAVKPEKDGKFLLTPTGMGATVKRPGYSEYFKKELVKQTGDRFALPEEE